MRVHVVDLDPYSLSKDGGLEDVSQVEKYRMSEAEYDKRPGTLRAWRRQQQEADPTWSFAAHARRTKAQTEIARLTRMGLEVPEDLELIAEGKDPETEAARRRGEARAAARRSAAAGGSGEAGKEADGEEGGEEVC